MAAITNTAFVKSTDRQASGNQPDFSTPSGSEPTGVVPPPGGGVTSVTAGRGLAATPNPIVTAGTIELNDPTINVEDYASIADAVAAIPIGGGILRIWVDDPGSSYATTPTVNISGGGGGTATAIVNDGLLVAILVTLAGTYATTPTVTISGGGGSGATAYAIIGTPCNLLFPPGLYPYTGMTIPDNVGGLNIMGTGAILYCTDTSASCITYNENVNLTTISGLTLKHDFDPAKWGNNASPRDPGCGIRLKGVFHQLTNLKVFQSPEFGFNIGDDPGAALPCRFVQVSNCLTENTCGDGFHAQFAQDVQFSDCISRRAGDDGFAAVCDSGGLQYTQRISFTDCMSEESYGSGFRFESCLDCDGSHIEVLGSRQEGIALASQAGGSLENLNLLNISIRNPNAFDPTGITGRGIVSEVGASGVLDTIRILGGAISDTQSVNGQGIYLSATGGAVIKNVMICGVNFSNIGASQYIFTENMTVASVIRNCTSLDPAKTQTDSGSSGLVTANNT